MESESERNVLVMASVAFPALRKDSSFFSDSIEVAERTGEETLCMPGMSVCLFVREAMLPDLLEKGHFSRSPQ